MVNASTQTSAINKFARGRISHKVKTAEEELDYYKKADKIRKDKEKAKLTEFSKLIGDEFQVGKEKRILAWAAEINRRDDNDINMLNLMANAIQQSALENSQLRRTRRQQV